MDSKYTAMRKKVDVYFQQPNRDVSSRTKHQSPTGNYQLTIEGAKYARGIVTRVCDGKIIADIKRNFSHFWFSWSVHANGCEYLLCGEDYQGQTVVNLTKEKISTYFPKSGYEGRGFCWTAAYTSPDSKILAVDGCYWAHPYDIVFFDFSEPDKLPYKEIYRASFLEECSGWISNEVFKFTRELEFRKADGVPYDALTEREQKIVDEDSTLLDHKIETVEVNILKVLDNNNK